jgi:hypothetical protein
MKHTHEHSAGAEVPQSNWKAGSARKRFSLPLSNPASRKKQKRIIIAEGVRGDNGEVLLFLLSLTNLNRM